MSFQDWLNPARNSPEAPSGSRTGLQTGATGAMIGSLFGPPGAALGGAIGVVAGGFSGSGARRRARRKATSSSYEFAKELFAYASESRSQINTNYDRELSMLTARSAASGVSLGDTFDVQKGKLIQERNTALADLDAEVSDYRSGPNYKWLRKDYERVTGVYYDTRKGEQIYGIGRESRLGEQYEAYSPEMRKNLRKAEGSKTYVEYVNRVAPTLKWYERKVFGDAEDQKAYTAYMNERISKANVWYDAQRAIFEVERMGDDTRK